MIQTGKDVQQVSGCTYVYLNFWNITNLFCPQLPHVDCCVRDRSQPKQHGWILIVPLSECDSCLFIYKDSLTQEWLIYIPFGSCFILRTDVIHVGYCGYPGNTRLQVFFIKHKMVENYRKLGHINRTICQEKFFYDLPKVAYNQAKELLSVGLLNKLAKYPDIIKAKYFRGGNIFLPTQSYN